MMQQTWTGPTEIIIPVCPLFFFKTNQEQKKVWLILQPHPSSSLYIFPFFTWSNNHTKTMKLCASLYNVNNEDYILSKGKKGPALDFFEDVCRPDRLSSNTTATETRAFCPAQFFWTEHLLRKKSYDSSFFN